MSIGLTGQGMPNPGTKAGATAALGTYQDLARQLNTILALMADLRQREQNNNYSSQYNSTPTYEVNPDGTPGKDDTTPNLDHPMTGTAVSAHDVSGFVGYVVNDVYDFLTGVSGPAVADRRPAIYNMLP